MVPIKDSKIRKKLGYRGPQNYFIPFEKYSKFDFFKAAVRLRPISFFNHASAAYIKKYIDKEIWDSYFKFCFERNPWDKVLSWYYWRYKTEPRTAISDFIRSKEARIIKGISLYTISSEIVVDKVFYYEQLDQSMNEISNRISLGEKIALPDAKRCYRKDKRSYKEILSQKDIEIIAKIYAREINCFQYTF